MIPILHYCNVKADQLCFLELDLLLVTGLDLFDLTGRGWSSNRHRTDAPAAPTRGPSQKTTRCSLRECCLKIRSQAKLCMGKDDEGFHAAHACTDLMLPHSLLCSSIPTWKGFRDGPVIPTPAAHYCGHKICFGIS